jgi:hypothetical protein
MAESKRPLNQEDNQAPQPTNGTIIYGEKQNDQSNRNDTGGEITWHDQENKQDINTPHEQVSNNDGDTKNPNEILQIGSTTGGEKKEKETQDKPRETTTNKKKSNEKDIDT